MIWFEMWFNCETQPPASIGWVALSSVFVRSFVVRLLSRIGNISTYLHNMMFQTIQIKYFLWGYDPGNMSVSSYPHMMIIISSYDNPCTIIWPKSIEGPLFMMMTIQIKYFLWGYDPGNMSVSSYPHMMIPCIHYWVEPSLLLSSSYIQCFWELHNKPLSLRVHKSINSLILVF